MYQSYTANGVTGLPLELSDDVRKSRPPDVTADSGGVASAWTIDKVDSFPSPPASKDRALHCAASQPPRQQALQSAPSEPPCQQTLQPSPMEPSRHQALQSAPSEPPRQQTPQSAQAEPLTDTGASPLMESKTVSSLRCWTEYEREIKSSEDTCDGIYAVLNRVISYVADKEALRLSAGIVDRLEAYQEQCWRRQAQEDAMQAKHQKAAERLKREEQGRAHAKQLARVKARTVAAVAARQKAAAACRMAKQQEKERIEAEKFGNGRRQRPASAVKGAPAVASVATKSQMPFSVLVPSAALSASAGGTAADQAVARNRFQCATNISMVSEDPARVSAADRRHNAVPSPNRPLSSKLRATAGPEARPVWDELSRAEDMARALKQASTEPCLASQEPAAMPASSPSRKPPLQRAQSARVHSNESRVSQITFSAYGYKDKPGAMLGEKGDGAVRRSSIVTHAASRRAEESAAAPSPPAAQSMTLSDGMGFVMLRSCRGKPIFTHGATGHSGDSKQASSYPNPNLFSLDGCGGSSDMQKRILDIQSQQGDTVKHERKSRRGMSAGPDRPRSTSHSAPILNSTHFMSKDFLEA
ncbi:hypothetical protein CYMTET_5369 [Cymbomonas tetramitiformis]|uniref:Uncharacterized protein n=1 Tax=Cymbomonas tetramitiformis TaxID=36881 RepID=A0AAE0GZA3_9CHLO|nr:hypothetical protein CYMTET_5369 [Cymbomonas tetramitiformis]